MANRGLGTLIVFFGGVFTGIMLAPRSGKVNRAFVRKNAQAITEWLDSNSKDFRTQTTNKAHDFADTVKKNTIPDLYEATDNLSLSDDDVHENLR